MKKQQSTLFISPVEYFKCEVANVVTKKNLVLTKESEFYLVNLLCDFINPKLNICDGEIDFLNTPMALILKKAMEAPPEKQVKIYKGLADTSLYISGYFQDYFNTKSYTSNYYISIGSQAYANMSSIVKNKYQDKDFTVLYDDLSNNFITLVEIINFISESTNINHSNENLIAIYERWTKNKSQILQEKLEKSGIIPINRNKKEI